MASLPGGTFTMGSEEDEDERPPHPETVAPFCIDRGEVTVAAYTACVARGACTVPVPISGYCNWGRPDRQDHPINCVTWAQAEAYCRSRGGALPEEAEWEFAARGGGEQRRYPWGAEAPANQLCWNGEGNDRSREEQSRTCPVGRYPRGDARWGVHDLAGNLWEWTESPFCPYDAAQKCAGNRRALRGGGWYVFDPGSVRGAYRAGAPGVDSDDYIGFRCVKRD
jgi:formylglycine-generating enzyme required for sulfatase activity